MCLHAGADQSQRITGELTAGAGHGAAGQQDDHAGVGAVGAVLLQVVDLQRLGRGKRTRLEKKCKLYICIFSQYYAIWLFRFCYVTQLFNICINT